MSLLDGVRTYVIHEEKTAPKCSNCGEILNAATGLMNRRPKAGDLTICLECGVVQKFTEGLDLVPFTEEEWAALGNAAKAALEVVHELARKVHDERNRQG